MYKALIWKEYRETRIPMVVLTLSNCIILFIMFIIEEQNISSLMPAYLFELAVLLMTIYTIMIGSEAFAREHQLNTFDFLVSRTLSRGRLWFFKLVSRFASLVIPLIILLFISRKVPASVYPFNQFQSMLIVTASSFFFFSVSFFFSIIFSRPFKAGITGFIFCLGFNMLFLYFFEKFFDFTITENYLAFTISSIILSILILIASFLIFTKRIFSYAA